MKFEDLKQGFYKEVDNQLPWDGRIAGETLYQDILRHGRYGIKIYSSVVETLSENRAIVWS